MQEYEGQVVVKMAPGGYIDLNDSSDVEDLETYHDFSGVHKSYSLNPT